LFEYKNNSLLPNISGTLKENIMSLFVAAITPGLLVNFDDHKHENSSTMHTTGI
jgi:hypothetical protein